VSFRSVPPPRLRCRSFESKTLLLALPWVEGRRAHIRVRWLIQGFHLWTSIRLP